VLFGAFSAPETILLPSSAATWSFQLIVDAFPSGKATGSLRGGSLLEESLPVITLGAVAAETACIHLECITLASVTTTRVEEEEEASRQSWSRDSR